MFSNILRVIVEILTRIFMYVWVGFNLRHAERLPRSGPAIIVGLHNSHLDTFALKSLLPFWLARKVRPVAAEDYFLSTRAMAWFSTNIMRIIPVKRGGTTEGEDPLSDCHQALERGEVLAIFPEGTRGQPEKIQPFKKGIGWLATAHPKVPVYVICIAGLGKVLGKGDRVPVPFFCDVIVNEPIYGSMPREEFLRNLEAIMQKSATELKVAPWI
jgi:1-acyl-sn-glycerol-3-phosphate acyltransferase